MSAWCAFIVIVGRQTDFFACVIIDTSLVLSWKYNLRLYYRGKVEKPAVSPCRNLECQYHLGIGGGGGGGGITPDFFHRVGKWHSPKHDIYDVCKWDASIIAAVVAYHECQFAEYVALLFLCLWLCDISVISLFMSSMFTVRHPVTCDSASNTNTKLVWFLVLSLWLKSIHSDF